MVDPTTAETRTSCVLRPYFAYCGKRSWYGTVRKKKKEEVLLWTSPRPACRAKVDPSASKTEVVEDFDSLREGLQEFKEEC